MGQLLSERLDKIGSFLGAKCEMLRRFPEEQKEYPLDIAEHGEREARKLFAEVKAELAEFVAPLGV